MKKALVFPVVIISIACGGTAQKPTSRSETKDVIVSEESLQESAFGAWKDMSFEDKQAFMSKTVVPQMGELFLANHPDFGCKSCHGENMADVRFKMPNTLVPLDPNAMPFESEEQKIREAAVFMKEKVVPKMAGLLDEEPYNPETKNGFGCFRCHATK